MGRENARHFGAIGEECFIEADGAEGVRLVGLNEFNGYHLRICRPEGLRAKEVEALIQCVGSRLGHRYDLHNIIDLARYFSYCPRPATLV